MALTCEGPPTEVMSRISQPVVTYPPLTNNDSTFPPLAPSGSETSLFRLLCILFIEEPLALKY